MMAMGMRAIMPWPVTISRAPASPMWPRLSNGVTTIAAMAQAAIAHTRTQY